MRKLSELIDFLKERDIIFIYGYGHFGSSLYEILTENNISIEGFMSTYPCTDEVNGCNIFTPEELLQIYGEEYLKKVTIIIGVKGKGNEILGHLLMLGYRNIISIMNVIADEIVDYKLCKYIEKLGEGYSFLPCIKEETTLQGYILRDADESKVCRVLKRFPFLYNIDKIKEILQEIEKIPYDQTEESMLCSEYIRDFNIYMVTTHKDCVDIEQAKREGLIPIQAGAALTNVKKNCIRDNEGINISERNGNYSECTALYWIWKNTYEQNYIGLCHYRRRFLLSESSISYLRKNDVDIVVTIPQIDPSNKKDYYVNIGRFIAEADWNNMVEFSGQYDKEYLLVLKEMEDNSISIPYNMSIMKRNVFDAYCEFVFFVADKIYEKYTNLGIVREDRYMGYIIELLLGAFIVRNKNQYNIKFCDVKFFPKE